MSERPAPARLRSLCGTARRIRKRNQKKLHKGREHTFPCRPSGMWACIGEPERFRRLGLPAIETTDSAR